MHATDGPLSRMVEAKNALDGARMRIRAVLIANGGLDAVDRDQLQSAILAIDWVRHDMGDVLAAAGDAGTTVDPAAPVVRRGEAVR